MGLSGYLIDETGKLIYLILSSISLKKLKRIAMPDSRQKIISARKQMLSCKTGPWKISPGPHKEGWDFLWRNLPNTIWTISSSLVFLDT